MRVGALALLLAVSGLGAQDSTCTYDRCALWMRDSRLFAGMPGHPLRGGPEALVRLRPASDSARFFAQEFRRSYGVGYTASTIAVFGVLTYGLRNMTLNRDFANTPTTDLETAWFVGSIGVAAFSIPFTLRANAAARKAAWWYNRELNAESPTDTTCDYDRCALWVSSRHVIVGMPGTKLRRPYEALPQMLKGSPGLQHAESYRSRILRGNTLLWAGGALLGGSLMSLGLRGFDADQIGFPVLEMLGMAAGALSIEAGIITTLSAQREAQRAAWWYNRALPRRTTASSSP